MGFDAAAKAMQQAKDPAVKELARALQLYAYAIINSNTATQMQLAEIGKRIERIERRVLGNAAEMITELR